jgi:hexosaminidase
LSRFIFSLASRSLLLACVSSFLVCGGPATAQAFVNTLLPEPASVKSMSDLDLRLDSALQLQVTPANSPLLQDAANRLLYQLQQATGIGILPPKKDALDAASLALVVKDPSITLPYLGMDESYNLESNGHQLRIEAQTIFGLQRGIATLLQLIQTDNQGYFVPAVSIQDAPRFAWRGLMLDPSRHFLPVDNIDRTLDAMAAVKLNVLHLHLADNQGFRIESKRFPRLTAMGSGGEFYTQEQIRGIVAYAAVHGIRVVPEFDMPGHSTSWFAGYPELASAAGPYTPDHTFGVHDEAIDPTKESTYKFIDSLLGEMADLFPDSYVHIGGDESNGKQWLANPEIVRFMKSHNMAKTSALQAYFNQRVRQILAKHGKTMIGWDEVLESSLPHDVVVQNWHGMKLLTEAAKQGSRSLYSQPYYLDHGGSAEQMYEADPLPATSGLTAAESQSVLGGEVCMWGEQVVASTLDSRLWPRTAAVAERFWSPASFQNDADDLYRRLQVESWRLDGQGVELFSGPQRLMRQLADANDPRDLQTLVSAVEPYGFHDRAHAQQNTTDTPMNGFVDAAVYDPPLRHEVQMLMRGYLHGQGSVQTQAGARLKVLFESWQVSGASLKSDQGPRLKIVLARAAELAELGRLGLIAMQAGEAHSTLTASQSAEMDNGLKAAKADDPSMVRFVILEPLQELFSQARLHH